LKKDAVSELKPGIFQIWGEKPGSHVYLIKGRSKNVLIDAGMAEHFPYLKEALHSIGLAIHDIHLIILTHEHFDHIGASVFFYGSAVVAAHRLAANKIAIQDEFVMMNKLFDLPSDPLRADIWLEGNMVIELGNYRLRVLHTPGHCSGCICLYEPDHKILFTGDTVLAGGVLSGIFPSGSISDYLQTLTWLTSLQLRALYPGHGKISTEPMKDLKKAVAASRRLLEESKILFGALDTKDVFGRLFKAARKFPLPPRQQPSADTGQEKGQIDTKNKSNKKETNRPKA
jgi:hydroxyacylglutathione hydrolase